ncbi:serine hydrolase [Vibrio tubiashii]|uniref:serine hydrolase domain-containing protein n=1 Tax=Vibrio tubiashii TaxID=29498 RepID=UPI00234EDF38|nr:serine hydrolase [Vibrio tubiashii]WCP68319.1 serine hydrolase [Vibrio tubiashii]
MKKTIIALTVGLGIAFGASAVEYKEPNPQFDQNLERYGVSVENWEVRDYQRFTMADSYLNHYHAVVKHGEPMPLKVINSLDISKIMVDDVIPNKKISMYNLVRDRAEIQSYVIMNKKGEIVAEDYWSNTDKETKHHLMSAHKSFSSMLFGIAVEKGLMKAKDPVGKYVPELKGTDWESIPVQAFADMTSGINHMYFTREGYHNWGMPDASSCWDSAMSTATGYNGLVVRDGKLVPPSDALGEITSFGEYLSAFAHKAKPEFETGKVYQYRGLNTEIMARAVEGATGKNLSELMEEFLWKKGGFTSDMTLYVNQNKESLAAGSMNSTNRDFAIGSYLMANDGKNWKGEQVLPKRYVDEVKNGDDEVKEAWDKLSYEHLLVPDAFYKNQWRTMTHPVTGRTISLMIGVNGQFSAFDHETGMSIATFGAYREHTGQRFVQVYIYDVLFPLFDELAKQ